MKTAEYQLNERSERCVKFLFFISHKLREEARTLTRVIAATAKVVRA